MIIRFLLRLKTFIKSFLFHVYAGFPKCSQEQILSRYTICEKCDMFNKKDTQCLVCGCNINKKRVFLNKLAWADQECPLGKWNKI